MTKSKITSKNQKGGITAKTVNFGNGGSQLNVTEPKKKKPEKSVKKIIITIASIIAFLASAIAILEYLNINPFK